MKRILYTLACLMLGISAWAQNVAKIGTTEYATLKEAVDAAQTGETVVLLDNITLTAATTIGTSANKHARQFSIDFNGMTIERTGTGNVFTIYDDVTFNGEGQLKGTPRGLSAYMMNVQGNVIIDGVDISDRGKMGGFFISVANGAKLILKSGTLTTDYSRDAVVRVANGGEFEMDGGKLVNNYSEKANSLAACVNVVAGGTATINDGEIEAALIGVWVDGVINITGGKLTSPHIVWVNKGTANISGGEFYANPEAVFLYTATAKANISGGEFWATGSEKRYLLNIYDSVRDGAELKVTGGIFHDFNPMNNTAEGAGTDFDAEGYCTTGADGVFTVGECHHVAAIGDKHYATLADAVAAVPTDGTATTITMLADVDLTATVATVYGQNVILDLNNHNITSTVLAIKNLGDLEVTGTGSITVNGTKNTLYGISNAGAAGKKANLIIGENVTVTAPCVAILTSYGKTIVNGTLANTQADASNIYSTLRLSQASSEVIVAASAKVTGVVNAIYGDKGTLEVNSTNVGKIYADGSATTGLKIKKTSAIESLNVYGHAEFSDVADYYVAAKAISGCTGTVKLLSDINAALAVSAGKTVTLDLNGHKVTAENYAIQVQGNLTITGEGTVQSTGMGSSTTVQAATYVLKNGKLIIESGNYVAGYEGAEGNPAVYVRDNAVVEIKGGDFVGGSKFLLNKLDASQATSTIEVTGGTFHNNFNPADNVAEGEHTNFVAEGYESVDNGDGSWTVIEYRTRVAAIGDVEYISLEEAIAAAQDGETVTLLTDLTDNITIPAGKNITLDLNGKTLNGKQTASTPTIKNLGTLTVKNGNVRRTGEGTASYYVIENMGTITLDEDLNVEGSAKSSLIQNNAADAVMTINAGTYTQTGAFIVVKNDLGNVVINGGTFSTASDKNVLNNWDQMTINGGTFTGNIFNGAFDTDNNKLTINDGTFNASQIRTYLGNGKTSCPIEIKGGTFTNAQMKYVGTGNKESDTDVQVAVSGGTFANPVPEKYCATGFIPKDNGNGTYGVKEGAYVARISEQGYETLDEAIEAAKQAESATTITLLANAETEKETLPANVTINANGKVLTMPSFVVLDGEAFTLPKITGTETYKVRKATYIRTNISATEWGTVCLPFSLTSGNGAGYYTYNNISDGKLYVESATAVAPHTPVVFKKGADDLVINEENATVSLDTPETLVSGNLVGTYTDANIPADGSIYFINGDLFHQAQVSVKVPMYRAYIKYTAPVGGSAPRALSIVVGGGDDATAIGTLTTGDADVEAIYDAAGRKLQTPQKGMNIMKLANGKTVKLIVK